MVDLEKVRYPRSDTHTDTQTHTHKTNTVVALAQAGNEARLGWAGKLGLGPGVDLEKVRYL